MAVPQDLARDFASHSGFASWQRTVALYTLIVLALVAITLRGGRRPRAAVPLTLLAIVLSIVSTWGLLVMHGRPTLADPPHDPAAVFYPAPAHTLPTFHTRRA